MSRVTADLTISLDGFVAGSHQSLENPLGEGGDSLHQWTFEKPEANAAAIEAIVEPAAFIMGRNMFGPGRDSWDEEWKGWWGRRSGTLARWWAAELLESPVEPMLCANTCRLG